MRTNVQVKMEYPFPSNVNAFLAEEWSKAANLETEESSIEECKTQCLDATRDQALLCLSSMDKIKTCIINNETDEAFITELWVAIKNFCNLIRCCSSYNNTRGEMFGLAVLLDTMKGED